MIESGSIADVFLQCVIGTTVCWSESAEIYRKKDHSNIFKNNNYEIEVLQSTPDSFVLPHPTTVHNVPLGVFKVGGGRHIGAVHWLTLKGSLTNNTAMSLRSFSVSYSGCRHTATIVLVCSFREKEFRRSIPT